MTLSPAEACDLIRFLGPLHARLEQAKAELDKRSLATEAGWVAALLERTRQAQAEGEALLQTARALPELAELREELAGPLQNAWVDALEKLLAGITFQASSRSPVIEALFPHQKFPALRKAAREAVLAYAADLDRRLKTGYVTRMLASDEFAFVQPVLQAVRRTLTEWEGCFGSTEIAPEQAEAVRAQLSSFGGEADLLVRQARLVAEGALVPAPELFESLGLNQKPRKRARTESPTAAPEPAKAARTEAAEATPAQDESAPTDAAVAADPAPAEASAEGAGKPARKQRKKRAEEAAPKAVPGAQS